MLTEEQLVKFQEDIDEYGQLDWKNTELLIATVRTLQQQNKKLVEAINKMLNIDPEKFTFYEYLYYACCIEEDVMKSIQGDKS